MFLVRAKSGAEGYYQVFAVNPGNGMISDITFLIWNGKQWVWDSASKYEPAYN